MRPAQRELESRWGPTGLEGAGYVCAGCVCGLCRRRARQIRVRKVWAWREDGIASTEVSYSLRNGHEELLSGGRGVPFQGGFAALIIGGGGGHEALEYLRVLHDA